jgi:hypothetical protein
LTGEAAGTAKAGGTRTTDSGEAANTAETGTSATPATRPRRTLGARGTAAALRETSSLANLGCYGINILQAYGVVILLRLAQVTDAAAMKVLIEVAHHDSG